jgi:hypothetical protein
VDYFTRRSLIATYGTKSARVGGYEKLPFIFALGPRVMPGDPPLVPRMEVKIALQDVGLEEKVGPLPDAIASEYPDRPPNLLDASAVEALLEKTGVAVAEIERLSAAFFADLRSKHSTPAPDELLARYPAVVAAGLPIRVTATGIAFVPDGTLKSLLENPEFAAMVRGQTCLFEGMYAHDVEGALRRVKG